MIELETVVLTAVVVLLLHVFLRRYALADRLNGGSVLPQPHRQPPSAPGWLPLLGHALSYKRNPAAFLTEQHMRHGAVSLDLAGFRTVVVSDKDAVRQVMNSSESVLSEKEAVSDFGFLEALGELCVYVAVSAHKRILKGVLHPTNADMSQLVEAAQSAVAAELPDDSGTMDVLPTMRRIMLRMTLTFAVSPAILRLYPALMDEYMHFQDKLEDAIAATAVLPKALARPLKLAPIARLRKTLTAKLAAAISRLWEQAESDAAAEADDWVDVSQETMLGVWLTELRGTDLSELPGWKEYMACSGATEDNACTGPITPNAAAQIVISLLFAAHKNPAIGAGQTLLMVLEHPADIHLIETELAAFVLDSDTLAKFEASDDLSPSQQAARSKAFRAEVGARDVLEESLLHLGCCISEACRRTAHTLGAIRKVMTPAGFEFSCGKELKYWVPANTYIAVSHVAVSLDTSIFPQADSFHPCRFKSAEDGLIPHCKYTEYEYTVFSQGLHRCPGQFLAMNMMKAVLVVLLDKFKVEKATDTFPPVDFSRATLGQRAGPCLVRYTAQR